MRSVNEFPRIYLHRDTVDFRKSINGLSVIVEQAMALSLFDDALFVFCNRSRDKLKVLYWDKTGFCLWYKRLEKDKFKWPRRSFNSVIQLNSEQMNWLLRGLDIARMQPHAEQYFSAIS
jgi:transposase